MSSNAKVNWCDSSCNPVMGCGGCPLWPSGEELGAALAEQLQAMGLEVGEARRLAAEAVDGLAASAIFQGRHLIAQRLAHRIRSSRKEGIEALLEAAIEAPFCCYAGVLHLRYGQDPTNPAKRASKGYAPSFERVTRFPGRMATMARSRALTGTRRPDKPWLDGLPRLVFVSDMGDALSGPVDFVYLKQEITDVVSSPNGLRHVWLWLTKRPARMAAFARWLRDEHGIPWPDNLVAMTSVIDQRMAKAIDHLREVPAKVRGLSVEPLIEPVDIDLAGIDWLIVGGESGTHARPFDIAWARALRDQCRGEGVAFFLKQLGRRPVEGGAMLKLRDKHGGDWGEWPADLRVRELPLPPHAGAMPMAA